MKTNLIGDANELHFQMLIAADMIANVEDRRLIYAVMHAAEKAMIHGWNSREVFYARRDEFPHIKLNMDYKNWDDE